MDDDSVIRIGRPPAAPPAAEPPKGRRKEFFIALAAGLVLGVAAAGFWFGGRLLSDDPVPMPVPSTPTLKVLDEHASCVLLVPAVTEAGNLAAGVIADPNATDWAKVQKSHDNLVVIADTSAPELRDDARQVAAMLAQFLSLSRTGGKMTFDMSDFKAAGLRIGARCAKYATG